MPLLMVVYRLQLPLSLWYLLLLWAFSLFSA